MTEMVGRAAKHRLRFALRAAASAPSPEEQRRRFAATATAFFALLFGQSAAADRFWQCDVKLFVAACVEGADPSVTQPSPSHLQHKYARYTREQLAPQESEDKTLWTRSAYRETVIVGHKESHSQADFRAHVSPLQLFGDLQRQCGAWYNPEANARAQLDPTALVHGHHPLRSEDFDQLRAVVRPARDEVTLLPALRAAVAEVSGAVPDGDDTDWSAVPDAAADRYCALVADVFGPESVNGAGTAALRAERALARRDFSEAQAEAEKALRVVSRSPVAEAEARVAVHLLCGQVQEEKGHLLEAAEHYKEVWMHALDPLRGWPALTHCSRCGAGSPRSRERLRARLRDGAHL